MEVCKDLKQKYDDCFNAWFSEKFLKGNKNDSQCSYLLKVYKQCVEVRFNFLISGNFLILELHI